jgi:photosystem II stability/assembly factor-like uncharacterized protein
VRWLFPLLVAVLTACGGDKADPRTGSIDRPMAGHIHALAVDPGGRALYVATHGGLFRVTEDRQAQRVGEPRDYMSFTIAAPAQFIASGHPSRGSDEPPLLGLIRSTDEGQTWTPIALRGEADFHVLRASRRLIYGVDAARSRLMRSADGGRSWAERRLPEPLADMRPAPSRPRHLIAAAESGLLESTDDGRSWRSIPGLPGLIAWPSGRGLYLVDYEGNVYRATRPGRELLHVGTIPGRPVAFESHRDTLYVATDRGAVLVSRGDGARWREMRL